MKKYKLHTNFKKLLADTYTPVGIYLKLRDKFPNTILLESSDYHGNENSFSFICCDPIAGIKLENGILIESFPDGEKVKSTVTKETSIPDAIKDFAGKFDCEKSELKFFANGLFGYTSYDAVKYFEEVELKAKRKEEKQIPDLIYSVYRYVIAIDHFKDELYLIEHYIDNISTLSKIEFIINQRGFAQYKFTLVGDERSNLTDREFISIVKKGKEQCKRGNIFQVVLSREFMQDFQGDEFNLYRALRSVNPSPYLFYFDQGDFKIFGSSPEAQVIVTHSAGSGLIAEVHPIAGTVKRTGDDELDAKSVIALRNDAKENAEHVMLVDLGRNDLSKNCTDVKVEVFAETQYYSHVIHLVSKVTGKLRSTANSIRVFADTFPAGTLSGAPKRKAMQIIDACENDARGYYGGCIGFIGFNGDLNHAIVIRSFLSKNNKLFYRAGAGVVIASAEENELQEVNNKLGALRSAIELAKTI